ncbi:MAG: DUF1127 domain-containing protein [Roseibium sp.]
MGHELETVFRSRVQSRSIVFATLRVFVTWVRRYMRRQAEYRALSRLTCHELEDIGLVRTQTGYRKLHQDRLGANYWNQ